MILPIGVKKSQPFANPVQPCSDVGHLQSPPILEKICNAFAAARVEFWCGRWTILRTSHSVLSRAWVGIAANLMYEGCDGCSA